MGLTGFRSASSSYTIGIPVGRFSSMMAASDIPGRDKEGPVDQTGVVTLRLEPSYMYTRSNGKTLHSK